MLTVVTYARMTIVFLFLMSFNTKQRTVTRPGWRFDHPPAFLDTDGRSAMIDHPASPRFRAAGLRFQPQLQQSPLFQAVFQDYKQLLAAVVSITGNAVGQLDVQIQDVQ